MSKKQSNETIVADLKFSVCDSLVKGDVKADLVSIFQVFLFVIVELIRGQAIMLCGGV